VFSLPEADVYILYIAVIVLTDVKPNKNKYASSAIALITRMVRLSLLALAKVNNYLHQVLQVRIAYSTHVRCASHTPSLIGTTA
jgi:hypothetical protein